MDQSQKNKRTKSRPLLCFPTELERRRFMALGALPSELAHVHVIGFGPVASAARCSQLLAHGQTPGVLLVGIAGSFDTERHPVGCALAFDRVRIDGIGAGQGNAFQSPTQLGFPQWPGSDQEGAVHEELPLTLAAGQEGFELLSVCSATGSPRAAEERRRRFPRVAAEDMEGFGVALACHLARTPLVILRGISNRVGERDAKAWDIDGALAAIHPLVPEVLTDRNWLSGQ